MTNLIFAMAYVVLAGTITSAETPITFAKKKLTVGKQSLTVEMALSHEQQERGLMFRQSLKDDAGMLFVYDHEQIMSFWMKNTIIPLAIGFFDKKKVLVDIKEMKPVASEMQTQIPTYESKKPAMYALEVNPGWFERHHVKIGDTFSFAP